MSFNATIWIVMGILLMLAEAITPGFILFFFGLAALTVGILIWIFPMAWWAELLIFSALSVVYLVLLRRLLKPIFSGKKEAVDTFIEEGQKGKQGVVTQKIVPPMKGRVEINEVGWDASADEVLDPGTPIIVTGQSNLTLHVKRV